VRDDSNLFFRTGWSRRQQTTKQQAEKEEARESGGDARVRIGWRQR